MAKYRLGSQSVNVHASPKLVDEPEAIPVAEFELVKPVALPGNQVLPPPKPKATDRTHHKVSRSRIDSNKNKNENTSTSGTPKSVSTKTITTRLQSLKNYSDLK